MKCWQLAPAVQDSMLSAWMMICHCPRGHEAGLPLALLARGLGSARMCPLPLPELLAPRA